MNLGRWAIEVASQFPTARVVGMDIAPIQPADIPANCEFIVGDLTEDLDNYGTGSIDLVHSRCDSERHHRLKHVDSFMQV